MKSMGIYKRWTAKEVDRLEELYGRVDTEKLCKRFNVSYGQLQGKVKRLGLGYQREADEYLTFHQASEMMGGLHYHTIARYVKNGLPFIERRFGKSTTKLIRQDDLIEWLGKNQMLWSAIKVEYMSLGIEPRWLQDKRRREYEYLRKGKRFRKGYYEESESNIKTV